MKYRTLQVSLVSATTALAAAIAVTLSAQPANQSLVGDATRGQTLYADTFNCYACHGFDALTGERRLLPMNYPLEGFITFVQNSPLPNMPAFPDASPQQLADIYAYIGTLSAEAPAVRDLPLLVDILERKEAAAAQ